MPKRIRRSRAKGARLPRGAVYVGRPGRWSNPFVVGETTPSTWPRPFASIPVRDRLQAVELFEELVEGSYAYRAEARDLLGGRDLACWCPLDEPCHADVLLRLANPIGP